MDPQNIMVLFGVLLAFLTSASGKILWDYHPSDKAHGPQNWVQLAPKCGGLHQSPIDIITSNSGAGQWPNKSPPVIADAAVAQSLIVKGKLINGGKTIAFVVNTTASTVRFLHSDSFSYTLRQFNFHFGCEDEMGSEHALDGQRFPGEIHFVFFNDKYPNQKAAVRQKDGFAALAFFMQYDKEAHNKALQRITDNIDTLRLPKSVADFSEDGISLTNLISAFKEGLEKLKFYIYTGSMTSPPCFESVSWFVFERPVRVNPATLDTWRNVLQGDVGRMCGNYRPVQKLNDRGILMINPSVTRAVVNESTPIPSVSNPRPA